MTAKTSTFGYADGYSEEFIPLFIARSEPEKQKAVALLSQLKENQTTSHHAASQHPHAVRYKVVDVNLARYAKAAPRGIPVHVGQIFPSALAASAHFGCSSNYVGMRSSETKRFGGDKFSIYGVTLARVEQQQRSSRIENQWHQAGN